MGKVSDATSRLLTWIESERRDGFRTPLPQHERAALVGDIQTLIDAVDLESMGRDRRLTYADETEDVYVFMVWSLKPGEPQIVSVCSTAEAADRYRNQVLEKGGVFHVEKVVMDQAFGLSELQSVMYRTGTNPS